MAKVRLSNIKKIFPNKVKALENITIDVEEGELLVLVGPSGCGKSTILRIIAGLEEPTQGEIYIHDKLMNKVQPKDRDIAMVFQNYALYPYMSAYENMAFPLKIRKFQKQEIDKQVREVATILGIQGLLGRKPAELSGGEKQRVAVGRAIVRNPNVFLFDEPLSNLDAKLRFKMRGEIIELHQRLNTTMIYVTHDQVEAMTMGDRVVVLKKGVVQQIDTPIKLYDSPTNKFVAEFIGSPPINFIQGSLIKENSVLKFYSDSLNLILPGKRFYELSNYIDKKVILGIRPEDISVTFTGSKNPVELENVGTQFIVSDDLIPATVEIVEPMGAETYLHLNFGHSQLLARVMSYVQVSPGAEIKIGFDYKKIHLFDKETERNILK